jgi:MFS family permease
MLHVFLAYGIFLALANATLGPLSYSTLLPRWFVRMRARAVGITALGYSIGGLTLPLIFHYLVAEFGWRDALRLFAGVMLVFVVPFVAWKVIDRPSDVGVYPDGDAAPPPAAASSNAATAPELPTLTVMRDINFWVLVLTIGLVVSGAAGVLANMSPYAISKGFSSAQGAIAVSCFAAGSFSSKTLFAAFGDRLKPRVGLLTGLFFFTVSSFGFMHADAYPVLLAAAYVHGLSVGTMLPLWSYLTALTFGSAHVGRVFGLITVTMMPISLIAPPLLGRIADVTGSYDNGFMLYVGLGLASALLVSRFRPEASAAAIAAAAA